MTTTNVLRRRHQDTPDLVLDASLNNDAQEWAEHLTDLEFVLQHSGSSNGENLYYRKHQGITDCDAHYEPYAPYFDINILLIMLKVAKASKSDQLKLGTRLSTMTL